MNSRKGSGAFDGVRGETLHDDLLQVNRSTLSNCTSTHWVQSREGARPIQVEVSLMRGNQHRQLGLGNTAVVGRVVVLMSLVERQVHETTLGSEQSDTIGRMERGK